MALLTPFLRSAATIGAALLVFSMSPNSAKAASDDEDAPPKHGAELRSTQLGYATGNLGITGGGITVGAYLPFNAAVDLSLFGGMNWLDFDDHGYGLHVVRLKKFIGNSFYVSAGLGELTRILLDDNDDDTTAGRSDSWAVADFGVGNQWVFGKHFLMSCEWLGFAKDLSGAHYYLPIRLMTMSLGVSF